MREQVKRWRTLAGVAQATPAVFYDEFKPERIRKLAAFLEEKERNSDGLLVLWITLHGLLTSVFFLTKDALEDTHVLEKQSEYVFFYSGSLLIWFLLNALLLLLWFQVEEAPEFSFEKAGILFAPHSTDECTGLVEQLYDKFCYDLANRGLNSKITHAFLPPTEIVRGHEDAHKLLIRTGAQVIIHGPMDQGQVGGKVRSAFTPISFTVRSLVMQENDLQPMIAALKEMRFEINEADSMLDKNVVAENLADAACFFVGMALMLQARQQDARSVFNELRTTLSRRIGGGKEKIQILKRLADHWWRINEAIYVRMLYKSKIQKVLGTDQEYHTAREAQSILNVVRGTGWVHLDTVGKKQWSRFLDRQKQEQSCRVIP